MFCAHSACGFESMLPPGHLCRVMNKTHKGIIGQIIRKIIGKIIPPNKGPMGFGPRRWESARNVLVSASGRTICSENYQIFPGMVRNGLGRPWEYYLGGPEEQEIKKIPGAGPANTFKLA